MSRVALAGRGPRQGTYHVVSALRGERGQQVAACSIRLTLVDLVSRAQVAPIDRCQRQGCKLLWPEASPC